MMSPEWGRTKTSTVIWPPHTPIWTIGAACLAVSCMLLALVVQFTRQTPLQRFYTPTYLMTSFPSVLKAQHKYRLLYIADQRGHARLAKEEDVQGGETIQLTGRPLHVEASDGAKAHGMVSVFKGASAVYQDRALSAWLRSTVYEGVDVDTMYEYSALVGIVFFLLALPVTIPQDVARRKMLKYGRRLKGPVLLTPRQFNKEVKGDGVGFWTTESKDRVRIPLAKEAQHIELIGDTGTGKSSLIRQILMQVSERGETAIVYDPACEYIQQFFGAERGDIVLNPLDKRCPYWSPADELRTQAEADAIADSLYQPLGEERKDEFFTQTPAQIFAHLLKYKPTPVQLVEWMSNPVEIERRVQGTEFAQFIHKSAGPQRVGVLSSLGLKAKSFRLLPSLSQAEGHVWSASEWSEKRTGWIFITSQPTERDALRPLISLWLDLLVMRLLTTPQPKQKPVWFVIDELASLQKLPKLHTAITENRKSGNPIVLGFQGKAQLETIYGHLAEVMMSQPATKVFLKTTEPRAAEWVSKAIGSVEIERMKETKFDGSRSGKNFSLDRQIDPLVMDSEISGLDDLHAFLKIGNTVTRFAFKYVLLANDTPAFERRNDLSGVVPFVPLVLAEHPLPDEAHAEVEDPAQAIEQETKEALANAHNI